MSCFSNLYEDFQLLKKYKNGLKNINIIEKPWLFKFCSVILQCSSIYEHV